MTDSAMNSDPSEATNPDSHLPTRRPSDPASEHANPGDPESPVGSYDQATGVVHDEDERPVVVHSEVSGPISEMTFLQKSLLFAELAMVAYNDEREATEAAGLIGFPDVTFFDHDGSQAYRFRNEFDVVIACRGTEPNEWNDIRADANAASVLAETAGKVHRGFKTEVDDLWPMLETALMDNEQPAWFCGHSLGAAMATICAGRCFLSHIKSTPKALFTYGSPRVGDRRYINYVQLDHYRFVNNNDIVTRVPPPWMGYRHCGREVYIDRNGKLGHINVFLKKRDRWRGFLKGLGQFRIDHFSDHPLHQYIDPILAAARAEEEALGRGEEAVDPAELTY
ncbi:triacylglycerol lipase [Neorhodopirellula lusitana]|uniref:Triacylglycerol lipase n=1 Tax=Neorhodopirellula lusitana TaxID=445327 RepID=A0ABY1Q2M3_9BACT|nr:lipase family protein [Neorhodopirellula lusitana]SMP53327.1 triacylglycerol lipase [Neorhodopirellula lusitana]